MADNKPISQTIEPVKTKGKENPTLKVVPPQKQKSESKPMPTQEVKSTPKQEPKSTPKSASKQEPKPTQKSSSKQTVKPAPEPISKQESKPEQATSPGNIINISTKKIVELAANSKSPAKDSQPATKGSKPKSPSITASKEKTKVPTKDSVSSLKAEQPTPPPLPVEAPRPAQAEEIVYLKLSDLHPFKEHPFQVRDDEEMKAMVSSVKDKGVTQPAIVRPRDGGGYEIVSGHRRHRASELAQYQDLPCIVRNLTDEQAITQMVEDNTNQRENILPSERAKALQMQLEAIKHQGTAKTSEQIDPKDAGKRSNEIVAERNKMTVKQVQRYIKLNSLVPDLAKLMDEGKVKFTPAVEFAYINPKNQGYIALAIDSQEASPSLSQAKRMRELDQAGGLNTDVIDGIMMEDKKEVDKVILSGAELNQYFGKEVTPREMKETIMKLLDDWKEQQPALTKPGKKIEKDK